MALYKTATNASKGSQFELCQQRPRAARKRRSHKQPSVGTVARLSIVAPTAPPSSVIQFTHLFTPPPPPLRSANNGPLQKVGSLWTFFLGEAEDNYSHPSGLEVSRNGRCLKTGMKGSRNRTKGGNEGDKRERGRKRPHPGLTGPQPAPDGWDAWNVNNLLGKGFNVCFLIYFPPRSGPSSFYFHV